MSQKRCSLSQAWKCGCPNEWYRVVGGIFKRTEWAVCMETREKSQRSNTLCHEPLDALSSFTIAPVLRRQDQSDRYCSRWHSGHWQTRDFGAQFADSVSSAASTVSSGRSAAGTVVSLDSGSRARIPQTSSSF